MMLLARLAARLRARTLGISLLGGCLGVAAPTDAAAQRVPNLDVAWRWVDFGPESGLPEGTPSGMVEADSVVWLRTTAGVAWYDGFVWQRPRARPDSLAGAPTSLAAAPGGGVLIVHGGRVWQGDPNGLEPVALGSPGATFDVVSAVPGPDGALIVATSNGAVWRSGPGGVTRETLPGMDDPGSLWRTDAGEVWVDTREGFFSLRDGGTWAHRDTVRDSNRRGARLAQRTTGAAWAYRPGAPETRGLLRFGPGGRLEQIREEGDHVVYSLATRADGLTVLAYESGDVRAWDGVGWTSVEIPAPRDFGVRFVHLDEDGDFWFGTDQGLHLFRSRRARWIVTRRPFPALFNRINTLLVTADTSIWIGTGDGIMRHKGADRTYWERPVPGDGSLPITGLTQDGRGDVWASSGSGFVGVLRFEDDRWRHLGPSGGFDVGYVHRVFSGPSGALWMASLGRPDGTGAGLWRSDGPEGPARRFGEALGLAETRTYAMVEGADGTVWIGTVGGLTRVRDGEIREWTAFGEARSDGSKVWDVALDAQGRPWMAVNPEFAAGIAYVDTDESVHRLMPPGPIGARKVWSLLFDESGALWLGTESGVLRYADGTWSRLDEAEGLPSSNIWPIALHPGTFLIGTKGGGLVTLNRIEADAPAPRVVVGPTSVQDRIARLRFSALSYWGAQPHGRIETRYRVDGGAWSPWDTDREPVLAPLSPGSHVVEVQAKGLLGRLSEPVATTVRIPLPLVLRPAFLVPVGGLVLLVLMLARHAAARRARHEEEILDREKRLRTLLESAPEAIGIFHVEARRFIEANRNALELFAVAEGDLADLDPATMTPPRRPDGPDHAATFMDHARRAALGESTVFDWTVRTAEGHDVPCEVRLTLLPSASGTHLRASLIDVRERLRAAARQRELEEQLRQSQKLEAVGQLTGGVAHDFNNLLTVIRGNLELLAEELRPENEARELLDGAVQAAERSASLTQRLLAFSRRQALAPGRVDVSELLDGLRDLLRRSLGEAYTLDVRVPPDTWAVEADRGQLESAIVNLALNARDAMPGGGRIVIDATNVPESALAGMDRELEPNDYVRLAVRDTGEGMEPDVVERAFDPFFTTKDVGKGTGLGLSMVYGYVAQSGGTVRIDSQRGVGTTVTMYLPRCATDGSGRNGATGEDGLPKGGGEVILVVEDDPGVGALVSQFLDRLGYRPTVAGTGEAALAHLREGLRPAALVTDMVLPGGMNGRQVAAAVRGARPALPVLFMSGYAEGVGSDTGDRLPGEVLRKPFDLATLARKMRRTLSA